jgi:hypothetical protein
MEEGSVVKILNIHERQLPGSAITVGSLIDGLAGVNDRLWPHDRWPPMRFDRPLELGAVGGHGPVRYRVEAYTPGQRIVFRFDPTRGLTRGFKGVHFFEVEDQGQYSVLKHVIDAECTLPAWLRWQILVRPLHDALLEDALDGAVQAVGGSVETPARWSSWVRLLRRLAARRRPA